MEKLLIPSLLTVSDVINLADSVLKITLPIIGKDQKLASLYEKNKLIFDRLVKNQKSTLKSEYTSELVRLDKLRDRGFVALRDILGGISVSLVEESAVKGAKLYSIIEKLGTNIYRLGYKVESAILLSLIVEFDTKENQQYLNDLGLSPYYISLKNAHKAFEEGSALKSEEKTLASGDSEAATMVLEEMIPAFTGLVSMLQLYAELEPAIYGEAFNKVATLIAETNTIARARKTRKQTKPEEEVK